jgi:hypothetical protein
MANVKISELPVATSVDVVDSVPLVQGGTTKQATQAALLTTTGNVTAAKLVPTGGTATGNGMYLPATNTLAWSTNGVEGMRLDASGNLGVGTYSPASILHLNSSANAFATIQGGSGVAGIDFLTGAGTNRIISGLSGTANIGFYTASTERMRLDASGNLITTVNSTAPTLSANSTMSFELTSNTSLKIVVRGTDGVTRSVSLTLA